MVDKAPWRQQLDNNGRLELSKQLCYILRHDPHRIEATQDGYAHVYQLLAYLGRDTVRQTGYTKENLMDVVSWSKTANGTRRFESKVDEQGTWIRASWGHSYGVRITSEEVKKVTLKPKREEHPVEVDDEEF